MPCGTRVMWHKLVNDTHYYYWLCLCSSLHDVCAQFVCTHTQHLYRIACNSVEQTQKLSAIYWCFDYTAVCWVNTDQASWCQLSRLIWVISVRSMWCGTHPGVIAGNQWYHRVLLSCRHRAVLSMDATLLRRCWMREPPQWASRPVDGRVASLNIDYSINQIVKKSAIQTLSLRNTNYREGSVIMSLSDQLCHRKNTSSEQSFCRADIMNRDSFW